MKIRSQRIQHVVQSDIRAMTQACDKVGGVNLGQGICDLPAPDVVKLGAQNAIDQDLNTYSRFDGEAAFRTQVANKLRVYNKVDYNPKNEIVATIGASGALTSTLHALTDPGDEIIVFEPSYGYHLHACALAGVVTKTVTLRAPDFAIDIDAVARQITPKTRAILVNTPSNPSGKVFTRAELEAIAELCIAHDILCITDEIYEYIIYDGREHISMASLPGMKERTILISGFSKTFSITGWRIGFAAAPQEFALAIGLLGDLFSICAPTPLQHGVAHALETLPAAHYQDMSNHYERVRNQLCDVLDEVGLTAIRPQGAYYVLCDTSRLKAPTARDAAMQILHEAGVAGVPGSAFFSGNEGDQLIRFCYAKQQHHIDEACERLRTWGRALSKA